MEQMRELLRNGWQDNLRIRPQACPGAFFCAGVIMKYLMQFLIIMIFSFVGELLNMFIPLPVPASVYGMVLLLVALLTGIVKLEAIEGAAGFLLDTMPIFFVGPTVRLMRDYVAIKDELLAFIIISIVSTLVTLLVTGHVAQLVIKANKKRGGKTNE